MPKTPKASIAAAEAALAAYRAAIGSAGGAASDACDLIADLMFLCEAPYATIETAVAHHAAECAGLPFAPTRARLRVDIKAAARAWRPLYPKTKDSPS